jgi:hypothetical protein
VAYQTLTLDEFEAMALNKPLNKADAFWTPIIDALAHGRIVKVPFETETEKKGRRLAAGRRSKKAGFGIEFRYGPDFMAIRRRDDGNN